VIGLLVKLVALGRAAFERGRRGLVAERPLLVEPVAAGPKKYWPLDRVVLAHGVLQTLFDDFARHRETARGEEEFGWALLGIREEREAIALAALPAGAQRHASLTHIQFHSNAQAVATRLLRQRDKRLGMLGVVHTHPGSLRHPSGGDYRGDIRFVTRLRGREGVFGIGTADARGNGAVIERTEPHQHVRGPLCFNWYALADGDDNYRKIPISAASNDDLARPLAPLWPTLETHADALERLCQQLTGVNLDIAPETSLAITIPLADDERRLRVLLRDGQARYYLESAGDLAAVNPDASAVDHGIYAILAELARRRHSGEG
jgi:proteasome lid subunit RPN8/RPN11